MASADVDRCLDVQGCPVISARADRPTLAVLIACVLRRCGLIIAVVHAVEPQVLPSVEHQGRASLCLGQRAQRRLHRDAADGQ